MIKRIILTLCLCFILFPALTQAQNETPIEYGQTVTGEITNRAFEVDYTFSGKRGDVVIIEMKPVDVLGDLHTPQILLLNADGDTISDTSNTFNYGGALLANELPADGSYTIIATRTEGRAGDSVGQFTLMLINPVALSPDKPVSSTITSEDGTQYYLIRSTGLSLSLSYAKHQGDFNPEVNITLIDENGGLTPIITMSGKLLETAETGLPNSENLFIVTLGKAAFDFYFNKADADYEITLLSAQ